MRVEHFEGVTLYLGDCREILPTLPRPAAIISDPPYGQKLKTNVTGRGVSNNAKTAGRSRLAHKSAGGIQSPGYAVLWPDGIVSDGEPFDPATLINAADIVLLWGAHRYGNRLPLGSTLVWDKVPTGKVRHQGDGEVAWLNACPPRPLRIFRLLWDGVCVGSAARHEVFAGQKRVHPTQKPEALMAWCIGQARVPAGGVIIDPYMGAGSTIVEAIKADHPAIGMEIEPLYFDTACRRVEAAMSQMRLSV